MEQTLTTVQIVKLRTMAQGLVANLRVGKQGLSEALLKSIDEELNHHQLIKIRILDSTAEKRRLAAEMALKTQGAVVAVIGSVVILFREQPDRLRRKITL